jgi:hypothetical protein
MEAKMAISQASSELKSAKAQKMDAYSISDYRFDLIVSLLSLWIVAGLYMDGSSHHNAPELIESFFTSSHALLYSGFAATAGNLLFTQWRNVSQGYRWLRALPKAYLLSLLGSVIFLFSGGADFLWHELFGFEVGLEALVSPLHLALAIGGALMITGPLRAALHRSKEKKLQGWGDLLPAMLSLLSLLSVLSFFTGDFSIITYPYLMVEPPVSDNHFFYDLQALASVLIPSAILVGILLFAMLNWQLPTGSLSLILLGNGLLMSWFHFKDVSQYPQVLIAMALAALAAEILYKLLRPTFLRLGALRLFAFLVPAIQFALFFISMISTTGIWWSVHLWTGSIFLAGVVGFLLSFLSHPSLDASLSSSQGAIQ